MTMRLTIKNEDASRTATVRTHDFNPATPETTSVATTDEVGPGETKEFWIHSGRKLEVLEAPDTPTAS